MKKLLIALLIIAMVLSLAACGGKTDNPDTQPPKTDSDTTGPESTEPDTTEPESTEPESTEPESTEPESTEPSTPGFGGVVIPGFGGVGGVGGVGGETPAEVPVADAGELVGKLAQICAGKTGELSVENLSLDILGAGMFSNWFGGMAYTEGTKVAVNLPAMGSIAHLVLLIEPAEGVDAQEYANQLLANANPRWQICVAATFVEAHVKDGLILFVMSRATDEDGKAFVDCQGIVDAFNA